MKSENSDATAFFFHCFPGLAKGYFKLTSPQTSNYNCVSWAAGDSERWWWPDSIGIYYWPPGIPRKEDVSSFVAAFGSLGYVVCKHGEMESGFEKIAIHVDGEGVPVHLSRQLANGNWTSKLGRSEDIEHEQDGVCGADYGHIGIFMKRYF
jgi:hypothetical protein